MATVQFEGVFKTVKVGDGKGATYDLFYLTKKDGKDVEEKLGNNGKLTGCKEDARQYVLKQNPKATEYKMIHHKPGREKDAKEILSTKKVIGKAV